MGEQLFVLFVVIAGAAVVPFFARIMRIPSAALEIIYGILVFNSILHHKPEWLFLMKEIGLIYLMFIAGMELNLRSIIKKNRFVWYILIPLLPLLAMPVIFSQLGYPFYLGFAVAMISAGIVIPVLKESGLIKTEMGDDIIGIALAGELLSILFLTGIDIYYKYGLTFIAWLQGLKLLIFLFLAAVFIRVMYVVAWWNPEKVKMVMESEDPVEEGMRSVILILFAGAFLTYTAGVEPILGSFLAGVIFGHVFKNKGKFEDKINAIGFGFFIPLFFIGVGANFDLNLFRSMNSVTMSLFLTIMLFLSNVLPLFFSYFMKIKPVGALGISFLLSSPLSLLVVAGTIGVRIELIDTVMKDSLILTAIVSSILFPFLFRQLSSTIIGEVVPQMEGESSTLSPGGKYQQKS
jgi:Kef-type K+ transport system membrane component KefB